MGNKNQPPGYTQKVGPQGFSSSIQREVGHWPQKRFTSVPSAYTALLTVLLSPQMWFPVEDPLWSPHEESGQSREKEKLSVFCGWKDDQEPQISQPSSPGKLPTENPSSAYPTQHSRTQDVPLLEFSAWIIRPRGMDLYWWNFKQHEGHFGQAF